MKKLVFLRVIMTLMMFSLVGESAMANGWSEVELAAVGGTAVAVRVIFGSKNQAPNNIARNDGFDISEITTLLGDYIRKYSAQIWREITNDIQMEMYTTKIMGVTDEYVSTRSEHTELLQPFQKDYTPKGSVAFTPRINKVRQIKLDYKIDCMDDLYKTYLAFMADESQTDRSKWPLVRYIVQNHIIPGIREEIDNFSVQGVYAAPTPGTPGASLDSVDGFLEIIRQEIAAANLVPIPTGVITPANALDAVETFHDGLPVKYRKLPGDILCSPTIATWYSRSYRDAFGSNNDQMAKGNLMIDGVKKKLVPIDAWEGSQRLEYTPMSNRLTLFDKVDVLSNFDVQKEKREVHLLGDFKRSYGYVTLQNLFVNEQE